MEYASGAFRHVEIFKDYVVKYVKNPDTDDDYDEDEATYEECMDSQANELGIWKDYHNIALCPIMLEKSDLHQIYMPRALTMEDAHHFSHSYKKSYKKDIDEFFHDSIVNTYYIYRINTAINTMMELADEYKIKDLDYTSFIKGLSELYFANKDVFWTIIDDLHTYNIGILENRIVVIDYAGVEHMYDWEEEVSKW